MTRHRDLEADLRAVSYGGGVQSTALLVLAAQRAIDFSRFVMANVGDDSEHPATLAYVHDVAAPYAAEHGIELEVIDRVKRDGTVETLYGRLMKEGSRSLPIPVRMSNGAPGTRSCTADFKIAVLAKWAKANGASAEHPATIGIGISADEWMRANNRRTSPHERIVYPLLGMDTPLPRGWDRPLRRTDCERLIAAAGIPVPPKSSCWFCPFHRPTVWADMAVHEPELFERAAHLEDTLNARRDNLGKDHVYLTRFNRPLRDVVIHGADWLPGFDEDETTSQCDSGHCFL